MVPTLSAGTARLTFQFQRDKTQLPVRSESPFKCVDRISLVLPGFPIARFPGQWLVPVRRGPLFGNSRCPVALFLSVGKFGS